MHSKAVKWVSHYKAYGIAVFNYEAPGTVSTSTDRRNAVTATGNFFVVSQIESEQKVQWNIIHNVIYQHEVSDTNLITQEFFFYKSQ